MRIAFGARRRAHRQLPGQVREPLLRLVDRAPERAVGRFTIAHH